MIQQLSMKVYEQAQQAQGQGQGQQEQSSKQDHTVEDAEFKEVKDDDNK